MWNEYVIHFGIILFPITVYQIFTFAKSFYRFPLRIWFMGVYGGGAAILCQLAPVHIFGQPENFQCVPIILSILYGKRRAGMIAVGVLVGFEVYKFHHAPVPMAWTIAGILIYSVMPWILCARFDKYYRTNRFIIAALLSLGTLIVELLFLTIYFTAMFGKSGLMKLEGYVHFLAVACLIQLVIMGVAFFLLESILENGRMRKRLESLVQFNPVGICAFDMNNRFVTVNAAYESITGYKREELLGRSRLDLWFEEDHRLAERLLDHVLHGNITKDIESKIRHKNGNQIMVRFTLVPMVEGDSLVGYFGMVTDVTEAKVAEEVLRNSEKLSAIGQLAAGVAHEIRNPLTAIKGFIQLLSSTSLPEQSRFYDIMKSELSRLEGIISEMLILAKPQAVTFRQVDVRERLEEVVNFLSAQANMQSVEIELICWSQDPLQVMGDANQLKQVFLNLAKNAIEAMPEGGKLTIRLGQEEDTIRVQFEDTGDGIPEEMIDKLGEPFLTTKEKGTGLGFLVSKRIISNHHGSLNIHSKIGEGTNVTVELPV